MVEECLLPFPFCYRSNIRMTDEPAVAATLPNGGTLPIQHCLGSVLDEIETRGQSGAFLVGLSTGHAGLDSLIGGLRNDDVIVLGGPPGSGKTSIACSIVSAIGVTMNRPVLFLHPGQARRQIARRLLALSSGVHIASLNTGRIRTDAWTRIGTAVERLADSPIFLNDSMVMPAWEIRDEAQWLKAHGGLAIIVCDAIHLLWADWTCRGRSLTPTELMVSLRILARGFGIPILVTAPMSTAANPHPYRKPRISDLSDSQVLEDADVILALDHVLTGGTKSSITRVHCLKNRNGGTGVAHLEQSEDGTYPWPSL